MTQPVASASTLIDDPSESISTDVALRDVDLLSDQKERSQREEQWQRVIDETLIEWGRDPSQLDDEGFFPPTKEALKSGIRICQVACDRRDRPPLRVVPDGDGGIVLEHWDGPLSESFEIASDGRVEYVRCHDRQVILRVAT